jgi:MoaA/NifB/PqqE/SkfB family radical SAM enzyme
MINRILNSIFFRENKRRYLNFKGVVSGCLAYKGPDVVQVDLTDKCNSNCPVCWLHSSLNNNHNNIDFPELDFEKFKIFIRDIAKSKSKEINFSGGGEPFCYTKIWEAIEFTQKQNILIRINTNFTLLDKESIRRLLSFNNLASVTASVWSGNEENYAKSHNRDKETFRTVKNNIAFFNQLKRGGVKLKIFAVINSLNYFGLRDTVDFAIETGCDFIEFGVTDIIPEVTDKFLLDNDQLAVLKNDFMGLPGYLSKKNAKVKLINKDIFLRRISSPYAYRGEYDPTVEETPCYSGWTFLRLKANGDFNSCLKSHRMPIGNIYREDFSSVWNNLAQQEFRRKSLTLPRDKTYFGCIGNNHDSNIGCRRICDNILVNEHLHKILKYLL